MNHPSLSKSPAVNNPVHIVLYIGHAYDLAFFLRLVPLIRDEGNYIISAVVALDPNLARIAQLDYYLNQITTKFIVISEEDVPRMGLNIYNVSNKIFSVLKKIVNIICKADLFVALDKSQLLPHILLNKFSSSMLIQTFEPIDLLNDYKVAWKTTLLANVYNILFGAKCKIIRTNKKSIFVSHHQVVRQNAEIIFRNGDKSLPNRIILPPLINDAGNGKKILIFGSRFLSWDYFTDEMKEYLLDYYKAISNTFKGYSFLYKPHPAELEEEFMLVKECFSGSNITNIGYDLNSELLLLNNQDTEYCFSLGSTSSLSAFEMGFKSFVLYKSLRFPKEVERTYDSIFIDAPEGFFLRDITDLENLPKLQPISGYLDYFVSRINDFSLYERD